MTLIATLSSMSSKESFALLKVNVIVSIARKSFWSIAGVLLDQENVNTDSNWPLRFLWTPYCFAVFIAIFGYFLNLMSTDLIAIVKLPELHSFNDFSSPYFEHYQPRFFVGTPLYSYMLGIRSGKHLHPLKQRIFNNENETLLRVNKFASQLSGLLNNAKNIMEQVFRLFAVKPLFCACAKQVTAQSYYSYKQTFLVRVHTLKIVNVGCSH